MKLKCHKIQRHLSDYIDETLSEQQAADVALHLRACSPCRREAAALKKTCNLIENFYVEPEAPDAYYTRFTSELQRRIEHMPPTAIHQQLRAVSTRLGWQLLTLLYRFFDRYVPSGALFTRQRAFPYYIVLLTMTSLFVAPFLLKQVPRSSLKNLPPVSVHPAATFAIEQDTDAGQAAGRHYNVNRVLPASHPTHSSSEGTSAWKSTPGDRHLVANAGYDFWQFTDEPIAEGYIFTKHRKNSSSEVPSIALATRKGIHQGTDLPGLFSIDSELIVYAEIPTQNTLLEHLLGRDVLTEGTYAILLVQGIGAGRHVLQQYERKQSRFKGFTRKLLDVPLEILSITEVYDSIEL